MREESHNLSKYKKDVKIKSQYVPDTMVTVGSKVSCPRCSEVIHEFNGDHGESGKCQKCGLNVQTYGNCINIWE